MNQNLFYFNSNLKSGFEKCFNVSIKNENSENNLIFYRPIYEVDGPIYEHMSQRGKQYLQKEIQLYNFMIQSLYDHQKFQAQDNAGNREVEDFENSLNKKEQEDLIKGKQEIASLLDPNLYPIQNQYILRQNLKTTVFEYDQQIETNTFLKCLIYSGQDYKYIQKLEKNDMVVIVINDKNSIHDTLKQGPLKDVILVDVPKEIKYDTFLYHHHDGVSYFLINEKKNSITLLRWIYQGIIKHFQPKYCYVGDLGIELDSQFVTNSQAILQNDQYFGVSGYALIKGDHHSCVGLERAIIEYNNFLLQQIQSDSLFKIKRFHNPFFGIYNWEHLLGRVDEYLKQLESAYDQQKITLDLNSILPELMWKECKKKLKVFSKFIGTQQLEQQDEVSQLFTKLCDRQYSLVLSNERYFNDGSLLQIILQYIDYFGQKLRLGFVSFIFIFSPYQIFYQKTESYYWRMIGSVVVPFFYILSIVLLILLPQQYLIGQVKIERVTSYIIVKLNQVSRKIDQLMYKKKSRKPEENQSEILLTEDYVSVKIKKIKFPDNNNGNYLKGNCEALEYVNITKIYLYLFSLLKVISFFCSVLVIVQIVMVYGEEIQNLNNGTIKSVTMLIILINVLFSIIRFNEKLGLYLIVTRFLNYTITAVFSEIYHILHFSSDPLIHRRDVSRLFSYLMQTVIIIFMLLVAETQTNFEGLIFIGVIGVFAWMQTINFIFLIIAKLSQIKIRSNQVVPQSNVNQVTPNYNTKMFPNYEKIIEQYERDLQVKKLKQLLDEKKEKNIENQPALPEIRQAGSGALNSNSQPFVTPRLATVEGDEKSVTDNFIEIQFDQFHINEDQQQNSFYSLADKNN